MPTQKVFKQRVRTRMAKTGESYTTARSQLRRKATEPVSAAEPAPTTAAQPTTTRAATLVSDESMARATGHDHAYWFALLDAWGAASHTHTEIARWLNGTQGVEGWWSQNITVAYERARGMRGAGQMADGYSVTVSRTFAADPETLFGAFLDPAIRTQWLRDASLTQRPTKAALTRRFDWAEPPSRIVVNAVVKADGRTVLAVGHERLADSTTADRMKDLWRERLAALQALLTG
jgi:uncharacterized protein YndB with AHSA1/START domain